jgi:hypothetical protein
MHSSQMCNSLLTAKFDVIWTACSLPMTESKVVHTASSANKGVFFISFMNNRSEFVCALPKLYSQLT